MQVATIAARINCARCGQNFKERALGTRRIQSHATVKSGLVRTSIGLLQGVDSA